MTTTPNDLMIGLLELRNAFDRSGEVFLAPFGLTAAQLNILNLLGEADGSMSQAVMSERVLIGKSSLSIVINRMVLRGHIKRQVFPKDRRRVILKMTPAGRRLWETVFPKYKSEVDESFGVIPPAKRHAFLEGMKLIEANLRQRRSLSEAGKLLPHV